MKRSGMFWILIAVLAILSSCSGSKDMKAPIEPGIDENMLSEELRVETESNRSIIAVYDAEINMEAETLTITPTERIGSYHLALSQLFPNAVKIVAVQFTPTFWADIQITNPQPGGNFGAFDPRVIAIVPANIGVRFEYPALGAIGNNRVVLEPDGYTNLFDSLGVGIPGTVNPFKAYYKNEPYRRWPNTGNTSETQRWNMDLAGFGGAVKFKLVIDVSTNYPRAPQPGLDNAPEPVQFVNVSVGTGLTDLGGSAQINVTLLDWQGPVNIICKVSAPSLLSGLVNLSYTSPSPNPNEYIFSGTISNALYAPQGTYNMLIAAADGVTGPRIFTETTVTVGQASFNPVDVTPDTLNFQANNIAIDGNLALVTGEGGMGANKNLYIFNITNPISPTFIKSVEMPEKTTDVAASNGYAYVTTGLSGVQIVNVNLPQSASIVNNVNTPGIANAITISGTSAIVADGPYGAGIHIFDITIPETAVYGKTLNIWGETTEVAVSGLFAYALNDLSGLVICDISNPASPSVINSVLTSGVPYDVDVISGYAYVISEDGTLDIVDVQPPQIASIVRTISFTAQEPRITTSGKYAYVTDGGYRNLYIVDITNPLEPFAIAIVATPNLASDVVIAGGYAFVADTSSIQVISIVPPETAYIAGMISSPRYIKGVITSNGYAYLSDYENGLQIVDISIPEATHIVKTVPTPLPCEGGIAYSNGYAYVCAGIYGLYIVDVNPVESATVVSVIASSGNAWNVAISGDYAYLADGAGGVKIIDINPPETAFPIQTLGIPAWTWDIEVSGNYAYATTVNGGLEIIDVSTPGSASIINSVALPGMCGGLKIANGYAYVANGYSGLYIINVDPPQTAFIVNSVVGPNYSFAYDVCMLSGYALVADYGVAMHIMDIDPPEAASIIATAPSVIAPYNISELNGYAYVAVLDFGLHIIKLF